MRRRASAAGDSLALLRWPCGERLEWLHEAAERCTGLPALPPPPATSLAIVANPLPPSPGMEAVLLGRSLPWPPTRAPAPAARSSEVRVGVGVRWLAFRLTGGLALPLRLARNGLAAPEADRLGRLLAGRLLYAVV